MGSLENLESRDLGLAQISTSQEPRIPKTLNPEPLHHNFKALRTEFESGDSWRMSGWGFSWSVFVQGFLLLKTWDIFCPKKVYSPKY